MHLATVVQAAIIYLDNASVLVAVAVVGVACTIQGVHILGTHRGGGNKVVFIFAPKGVVAEVVIVFGIHIDLGIGAVGQHLLARRAHV